MKKHLKDVKLVLEKLKEASLKINLKKCQFAMEEIKLLGHVVNKQGILPNPDKIRTICELKPLTNVTGVKSLL